MDFLVILGIALALPLLSAMTRRWQLALFAVMLLVVFEGALRKWVFPGQQGLIYFIKDGLLLLAMAGLLASPRKFAVHEPLLGGLKTLLIFSTFYFLLEIANPNSPSLVVGLIGFKSYMLYALLLFAVPFAFNSARDLDAALRRYMLLMIPVALLGLVQFNLPADHFLNAYVKHDENAELSIAGFGDTNLVRTTGTFSYLGGYATFLTVMFYLSLAYIIAGGRDFKKNFVPLALLGATTAAMFTTGSRGLLASTVAIMPFTLFLCMRGGLVTATTFLRITFGCLFIAVAVQYFASDAIDAFVYRANNSDSAEMRILSPFTAVLDAFEVTPLLGLGIGVTHNSVANVMGITDFTQAWWLHGNFFESETARVMQEVGIVGFLLVYAARISILLWAAWMSARLRTPLFRALSACIAGFSVGMVVGQVISNPTANAYLWFSAGLLFLMYRLDFVTSAQRQAASRPSADFATA